MNCLLYIRFSTPKQEDGSSKERQLEDGHAFIEQNNWTIAEPPICDLGRSAWKGVHLSKGNLGKLAKRIFDGDIPPGTILVCEELDRLSRQKARITLNWIQRVCDAGILIATTKSKKLYSSENLDENLLTIMEILMKAQANWEYVEMLAHRVKRSYDDRLKQARIDNTAIGSQGPAWLEAVGKRPNIKWVPRPERVRVVREIFDLAIAGHAPWTIARIFNDRGEKSFTGIAWERTSVVKIIRNRAIEGDYVVGEGKQQTPTGEVLLGYYKNPDFPEPTVPLDVVAKARENLDQRKHKGPGRGRTREAVNNLFGQKIRCAECQGRMSLSGYQNRYMVCYEASRGNGCTHKSVYHYRNFERAALDSILPLALDDRFFRKAQKSNHLGLEIAAIEKAVRDWTAKSGRAYDMWDKEQTPTAKVRYLEAEAEIVKLGAKLDGLNRQHAQAKGAADAEAHLLRVHGVREALTHEDDEVRLPARLRVSEALQGLVEWVACAHHWETGEKIITMAALGGAHTVIFYNDGGVRWSMKPGVDNTAADFVDEFDPAHIRHRMDGYMRRLKA